MFSWLKTLIRGPEPLPPLGFKPKFIDPSESRANSVVFVIDNDDTTPMNFVVRILTSYFEMGKEEAVRCMLKIHTEGSADIRTTSATDARKLEAGINQQIAHHGHPLRCYFVASKGR